MKTIDEITERVLRNCSGLEESRANTFKEIAAALRDASEEVDEDLLDAEEKGFGRGKKESDDDYNSIIKDKDEEIELLESKVKFRLPANNLLDELKAPIVQRMFQNLSIEQLEEVEKFAKSMVKHPAKYIEFIHEN